MRVNFFKVRKWTAHMLIGFLPVFFFFVGVLNYGLIPAVLLMFVGIFLGSLLANKLLRHAFTDMLEGQGLMTLTIDSTGVILPFITAFEKVPFIRGLLKGKETGGLYSRDLVFKLLEPRDSPLVEIEDADGKTYRFLELPDEEKKPDKIFSFGSFPTFIFNKNLDAYLSKDAMSKFEKDVFINQNALYIQKKLESISGYLRDFGRYMVELSRPQKLPFYQRPLFKYLLIGIMIVLIVVLFGPTILETFSNVDLSGVVSSSSNPVT